ncbi:MAG: hypothetical protein KBS76_00190, partial [Ruminococcus sp.]|nr:hypothetical protein [Candidatus Apopatosoma intestinale]
RHGDARADGLRYLVQQHEGLLRLQRTVNGKSTDTVRKTKYNTNVLNGEKKKGKSHGRKRMHA